MVGIRIRIKIKIKKQPRFVIISPDIRG